MILLKVTNKQGFILSLKDSVAVKSQSISFYFASRVFHVHEISSILIQYFVPTIGG